MKKFWIYLILSLIAIELLSRCIIFYDKINLSYRLSKGYYNFRGNLWDYMKEYRNSNKKYRDYNQLIIEDIYNRQFYVPNADLSLNRLSIKTNSFGMKEREVSLEKESGVYRILCLGSSLTLAGSDNNRFTELLETRLNDIYKKKKFEVINAGVSSQNIFQGFMCYAMNWRLLNPDIVVIDYVFDDVPANEHFYLKNFANLDKANEAREYLKDYLKEHIGLYALIDSMYARDSHDASSSVGPTKEGLDYYKTVLESLVLLAKANGARVILLSCGIAVDRGHNFEAGNAKRNKLEGYFEGMDAGKVIDCIEELNKIMKMVAQDNGVIFIDMSKAVPKDDEHFVDASHRSDKGNDVFADKLMEQLTKNNIFN